MCYNIENDDERKEMFGFFPENEELANFIYYVGYMNECENEEDEYDYEEEDEYPDYDW